MADANLIDKNSLGTVNAIDFVNQFGYSVKKLQEALGVTRLQPMKQGNQIQTYKFGITKPKDSNNAEVDPATIGEGETIPLTKITREVANTYTVGFSKYRMGTTIEAVQKYGYDLAVEKTQQQMLQDIQKDIRAKFFSYLGTAPNDLGTVGDLQDAYGKVYGKLLSEFDTDTPQIIMFINPVDAGNYLGTAAIQNGQGVAFGLTLLKGFLGGNFDVILNASVPAGTFYATVKDNINLQYIDVNGESSKLFQNKTVTTDETGLIALVQDDTIENLSNESVIYQGINLFAEVENGVLKGTLGSK
ncbi:hypothetical protein [Liquorilactobacillus nagelii]|uniref:hypothetical protein n=1 Tax=Liquorilactobacillus nagelii TaxID=82688 RepID=UPI0006EFDED5|nr:hypothetical protein [Liquorilactobacillus nagelii]KRL40728.1 phage protein [Liquorilactobacillus nagelii DSM 13675]QYH53690.1 hypothetical protein G6O73_02835 [Liquorilactobacillus nagelii DSM 13675]